MGLDRSLGIHIGRMEQGPLNLITDVKGVLVGHQTLDSGSVQTGVTAIVPHGGNCFEQKLPLVIHVINGFGKSMGLVQAEELGQLETPILLTNTLSAGTAFTALCRCMLEENPAIGRETGTVNPVVMECNDGWLNDIRGLHIGEKDVYETQGTYHHVSLLTPCFFGAILKHSLSSNAIRQDGDYTPRATQAQPFRYLSHHAAWHQQAAYFP